MIMFKFPWMKNINNKAEKEAKKTLSEQEKLKEKVADFKKYGRNTQLGLLVMSLLVLAMWVGARLSPIPKFSEMKVTEGVLIGITGDTRRSIPNLLLREGNGSIFFARIGLANKYRPYMNKKIKVWTTEGCLLFGYMCKQSVFQAKYMNEYARYKSTLILDYRDVRSNMEKLRYGFTQLDLIVIGFELLFFFLFVFNHYDNKKKLKKLQSGEILRYWRGE